MSWTREDSSPVRPQPRQDDDREGSLGPSGAEEPSPRRFAPTDGELLARIE